jgi:hypothetical protein
MQAIAPSSIMRLVWWFAKGPWKPADSSATRKMDRINVMTAAMQSPTSNERRGLLGRLLLRVRLDESQHCLIRKDIWKLKHVFCVLYSTDVFRKQRYFKCVE